MSRPPVRGAVVGLALALLPLVAGCGGGMSYCDKVSGYQASLGVLAGSGQRNALLQALPAFEDLRAAAPSDVADDWQLLVTRVLALQRALAAAHVDPATYDAKHPPPGLTGTQRAAITRAAAELAASDTQQALDTVQQEVLDVCHTPLDL